MKISVIPFTTKFKLGYGNQSQTSCPYGIKSRTTDEVLKVGSLGCADCQYHLGTLLTDDVKCGYNKGKRL